MLIPGGTDRAIDHSPSESEVTWALKRAYGLKVVELTTLPGEVDSNFQATCDNGAEYLVKISGGATSDRASVEWSNRILAHLAQSSEQLPVPRLIATTGGSYFTTLADPPGLRLLRVMTWQPGTVLARLRQPADRLWAEVGTIAGQLYRGMQGLRPDPFQRTHYWDLRTARSAVASARQQPGDDDRGALLERILARYDRVVPRLERLPQATVHHDLNDFNLLVEPDQAGIHHVSGIVDFSDALHTCRVAEVAISSAYAMLNSPAPLDRAASLIGGYHTVSELEDVELAALFGLILGRAATNAATWASRAGTAKDPGAARIARAWELLEVLDRTSGDLAEATFRHACGRDAWPAGSALASWLSRRAPAAGTETGSPVAADAGQRDASGPAARQRHSGAREPALLELGQPLGHPAGSAVPVPLAGVVERAEADSGQVVVRHAPAVGLTFWTQWTGVTPTVAVGAAVGVGQSVGLVRSVLNADPAPARLHLITSADFVSVPVPRFVRPSAGAVWEAISPPPGPLAGAKPRRARPKAGAAALGQRAAHAAAAQRTYFRAPMNVVSSSDVWLYDEKGFAYLDVINNVSHVGHCHPAVTEAIVAQVRELNTNSRLLYEGFGAYAERLSALLPDPLDTVFFTCTGSEANDLALRIVRQVTGREDVVVVDGAYHGNTTAVLAISPDRFWGPGGGGRPASTHVVPQPNQYRGRYRYADGLAGQRYAQEAASVIDEIVALGRPPAAIFTESLIGTGGEIPLPAGYLAALFESVRAAGGLCVSDEIQVGLGRLGSGLWGFGRHAVVPDMVTLGKPLGNGMPLAAVVTTREIAAAFDIGARYFNTFAGNPVSCAAGLAVLDVIETEGLREQAEKVGAYLLGRLRQLADRHALIGDVRGEGLYLGVELVRDRDTLEPAGPEALYVCERMKDEGVLIYSNGPHGNVLKIKPPMTFRTDHADLLVDTLDEVLGEEW
jgi:4-aminobutyrate aminotransferase-like enzyme/Ser/Thr protein kinase RdoA (MazF antagonist)